jgi:threonine/homoserine/homoserine lactone efflux protein
METLLFTLAGIAGAAWLVFVALRLGQAHVRLDMLRHQRRRDSRLRR